MYSTCFLCGVHGEVTAVKAISYDLETCRLAERVISKDIDSFFIEKYFRRHGLVRPKMVFKVSWRHMTSITSRDVARFA